jgi:predicted Rossmann fold flavoprotein
MESNTTNDELRDVVIVGAGAAGSWAAWRAAAEGVRDILLLEKTPRLGTKILASGGTRCNLTTTLAPNEAANLFGITGGRFLRRAFRILPPQKVRDFFTELGVPTLSAPLEKVFPMSGQAKDVRDALLSAVEMAGVELRLNAEVTSIEPLSSGEASWSVKLESGKSVRAKRLVLATGGMSFPGTGTTGDGYPWIRTLGLGFVDPAPALTPIQSDETWVHELAGNSLQDVELRLLNAQGKELGRRRRPLLFTHTGVSGPGAMDLSGVIARTMQDGDGAASIKGWALRADLMPDVSREDLREVLIAVPALPGRPLLMRGIPVVLSDRYPLLEIPSKRILNAVFQETGLSARAGHQALTKSARHDLIEALKGLQIPVSGTLGFNKAEVTSGGLALRAVDPGTCRIRGHEHLWVIGELLDVDGPIGGLNFQSAFATGEVCALDLAKNA